MPYTCLDFDGPWSIVGYFLNWGPLVGWVPGASGHPLLAALSRIVFIEPKITRMLSQKSEAKVC